MDTAPNFWLWQDILSESPAQREARKTLEELDIFSRTAPYTPILCGSYPLDITLPHSDIDVSCYAPDLGVYASKIIREFRGNPGFYLKIKTIRDKESVVTRIAHKGKIIELFAQEMPVIKQHGFLHMVIEWFLLQEGGRPLKRKLMKLRSDGLKTEPAFSKLLGLEGDPYIAMLGYGIQRGFI